MANFTPAAVGDDGFWKPSASWFQNAAGYLGLGNSSGSFHSFIRFPNVTIPSGSLITAAELKIKCSAPSPNVVCRTRTYFNAEDNPSAPGDLAACEALSLTTNYYDAVVSPMGAIDTLTLTLPVALLQEIIDRPGWVGGNALLAVVKDNGSDTNAFRQMYEYSGTPTNNPVLTVTYVLLDNLESNATANNAMVGDISGWRYTSEDVTVDDLFLDNIAEFEESASASFSLADNLADWLTGATANIQFTVNGIFNTDLYEESTVRSALLGTGFYALTIDDGFDGADASDRCLRYSMSIAEAMDSADSDEGKVQKIGYIYDGTMIWDAVPLGWLKTVPDTFDLADAPSTPLCLIIPDVLTLIDEQFNLWDGVHTIEETAVIRDSSVYAQYLKSIADTMGLADLPRLLLTIPISDWLTLNDAVPLIIRAAILESMLLSDTSLWGWDKTIADTFATADAPSALATFNRAIAESLALAGAASFLKIAVPTIADTMALTDVSASAASLYNIILESLSLNALLDLEGELWECFVLNTPRFHASMYSGYNFNSFCVFNGRAFGANDTGIFELTGSTDAGDTIHTGVVLKGTDFGAPNQKRMRRGYFGVSGSSPVLILETESGQRQVYSIDTKGKTVASHELKSKSWSLSIADFDALDSVKLIPVILSK